MFIGAATMAAGMSTMVWSDSYWVILAGMLIGPGLGAALANVSAQAMQIDTGRDLGMATVASLSSAAFAAGFLLGAIGGGRLVDATSIPAAFLMASGVMLIGGTVFLVRVRDLQARATATAAAAAAAAMAAVASVIPTPSEDAEAGEPLDAPAPPAPPSSAALS